MAHDGGPLLVLAGPGTGKTTTIVETVVDRIERRGLDPERVLVLTFSRKAARGAARAYHRPACAAPPANPLALTFHSYAYALLRREAVLAGRPPPRLLTGPEQLLEIRRLLHGELEDGATHWPSRPARGAQDTRVRRGAARLPGAAPPSAASTARTWSSWAANTAVPTGWRPAGSPTATPAGSTSTPLPPSTTPS